MYMPPPEKSSFLQNDGCRELKIDYYNCAIEKFCSNKKFLELGELVRQCEETKSVTSQKNERK